MKASIGNPEVTDAMMKVLNCSDSSSCSSSSSCADYEAAYTQKFNCYDGTFGDDVKLNEEKLIRLRSLGLSSASKSSTHKFLASVG